MNSRQDLIIQFFIQLRIQNRFLFPAIQGLPVFMDRRKCWSRLPLGWGIRRPRGWWWLEVGLRRTACSYLRTRAKGRKRHQELTQSNDSKLKDKLRGMSSKRPHLLTDMTIKCLNCYVTSYVILSGFRNLSWWFEQDTIAIVML